MFISKKGISLVELMITLFVTSLISVSVYYIYDRGLKDFSQVKDTGELQNESTYIFSLIEKDLARGGFVHPIRGDITNSDNCKASISNEDAVKIVSGTEVSACYDKPSYDGAVAYRYKITYKKGPFADGPDSNTLYKKIIRSDDCDTEEITDSDPNFATTIHDWQPVSTNINSINFNYPVVDGDTQENVVNIDIAFQSKNNSERQLNFDKSVFLRNKNITTNTGNCDDRCPNSIKPFSDYNVSSNTSFWNPTANNVPSARVIIEEGFDTDEDKLKWDSDLATTYGLTVSFSSVTGVLSITGTTTAANYQNFLREVRYVNTNDTPANRDVSNDPDRKIILALGADVCSPVPRIVGTTSHFYCYQTRTSGGSGSWDPGGFISNNDWYWWGEAEAEAEASRYYNLRGYLATVTSSAENDYIKDRIRRIDNTLPAGWIGGSDVGSENTWRWMGGPEEGQAFFSDDNNCNNDSWVIPWAGACNAEPNNNMGAPWWSSEAARAGRRGYSCELGTGFCCDRPGANANNSVCDGEHYTQYKSDGDWNDLFLPGYNRAPYQTDGYVLEFSTNFVSTNVCGNANNDQRFACVNYLLEKNLVIDDFTYQDEDMLNLCDINP